MRVQNRETMALSTSGHASMGVIDPPADGMPGYQFLRCLEQNSLGETWEVSCPDNERRLAQVLPANTDAQRAVDFLIGLTDEHLPAIDVFQRRQRPVIVVRPLVRSLRDHFRECWARNMPGLDKKELLHHLDKAALTLDHLLKTQRVQHLDLRPENLLISENKLYILGFGLMHHVWLPARDGSELPNSRYAAPELFQPHISSRCDQYSLALIYAEMLTGVHPLRNHRDTRRGQSQPDLSLLASAEREVVAKALSVSPSHRFGNASEFIHALTIAGNDTPQVQTPMTLQRVVDITPKAPRGNHSASGHSLDYFVSEMLLSLGAPHFLHQFESIRYKMEPGRLLEHHCAVRLFPGAALLKLEGFRQKWQARRVHDGDGLLVFRLGLPSSFWRKLTGRNLGLEIQIQVVPGSFAGAQRSEVVVLIRPYGCSGKTAISLLNDLGPKILDSLRGYLQAQPEQRHSERLPCNEVVRIMPVVSDVELAEPIECVAKDISSTGIGFFLSRMPSSSQVYINIPKIPELARFAGLAEIVRAQPCGEGWFEIGARFANTDLASS